MNKRTSRRWAKRRSKNWSSHVVGPHTPATASGNPSRSSSRRRRRYDARSDDIRQMRVHAKSLDGQDVQVQPGRFALQTLARKHRIKRVLIGVAVGLLALAVALSAGFFAFRASLSATMAIDDSEVTAALATPEANQPYYVLIAGISGEGTSAETASYLTALRVDEQNNVMSFLNVPSNISASLSQDGDFMLRDTSRIDGEGGLIAEVSERLEVEFAHYIRITDESFVNLVDALGGITVTVEQRVDDPRVSSTVIDVGEQTLDGSQALTYVRAYNYEDGRTVRASHQQQALSALIAAVSAKTGFASLQAADALAGAIKTDMNLDELEHLASVFARPATVYFATIPGSTSEISTPAYFSVDTTSWNELRTLYVNGEEPVIGIDTSGVDKPSVSLVVLNGSGIDGLAARAAEKLTAAGYVVSETGNTPSYVYNETLVIYREEKDLPAAEAIIQDMGVGRSVPEGIYYSLTTDVQVIVGKDWDQFV